MSLRFFQYSLVFLVLCLFDIADAQNTQLNCYRLGAHPSFIIKFKGLAHVLQRQPLNKGLLQNLSQTAGLTFTGTTPMSGNASILYFKPNTPSLLTASKTTGCYPRKYIDKVVNSLKSRYDIKYVDLNLLLSLPKQHYDSMGIMNQPMAFNWNIQQIKANQAWAMGEEGDPKVIIAVIDSGILNNLDLNPNIVQTPSVNFTYDGGARYGVGANIPQCNPSSPLAKKGCIMAFHGTLVAGVVANTKEKNYGEEVPGVGPKLKVLPVNDTSASDDPADCGLLPTPCVVISSAAYVNSLNWISGNYIPQIPGFPSPPIGIHAVNISQGGQGQCASSTQNALNNAYKKHILVTAAAGNSNYSETLNTPSNCQHIIAVAATASFGQRASYSNYGGGVLLAAPGGNQPNPSATPPIPGFRGAVEDGYKSLAGGTSSAAPAVAGVAGLLYSYFPDLTPDEVTTLLSDTVSPFPSYKDYTYDCNNPNRSCGKGIVNAFGALKALQSLLVKFTPPTATAMKLSNKLSPLQYCKPGYFVPTQQIIAQQEGMVNARWSTIQDASIGCKTACQSKVAYNAPTLISKQSGDKAIAKYGSICYELHSDKANCGLIDTPGQTVAAGCFK